MNRYNVTVRGATGTLQQEGDLALEEAIHELALPIDETADFEEMTFRQHGKTITLTRCPDPEPLIVQVLLTYHIGGDTRYPTVIENMWKEVIANRYAKEWRDIGSMMLLTAEIVPPTPSVAEIRAAAAADPENAFLTACEGPGEDVTPLEWLSALLNELRELQVSHYNGGGPEIEEHVFSLTDDPPAMWTAYHAACILLTDLRTAVDRAKGKPLPGVG